MSSPKNMQEISQETLDFISTLPSREFQKGYHLYNYQGFWYIDNHLLGVLSSQKHFTARDSDVFVITNPKCGTTWMKALTFTLLNRERHPVTSRDHPLLTRNPHDLVPFLELDLYKDGMIPDTDSIPSPRLLATHRPFVALPDSIKETSSKCKVVYVARNPKDTLVSLHHFLANFGLDSTVISIQNRVHSFCEGFTFYGPFWDHVLEYWKVSMENSNKVLFLKYEDMKEEPQTHLRRLAEFLNCPFSAEEEEAGVVDQVLELTSFDHPKGLEVNKKGKTTCGKDNYILFRKGEVGDWENYLTAEMSDKIDHISRLKFAGTGLEL